MTAIVPQPGQLSPEAARLRQYLRWATIPNFVAIAALFAIDHVTQARPALLRATVTRHDKSQVDYLNDEVFVAAQQALAPERETYFRPVIDVVEDRQADRPHLRVEFVSSRNERVVLDVHAATPASTAMGGLVDPVGHAPKVLPLIRLARAAFGSTETRVAFDGEPYPISSGFIGPFDAVYSEAIATGLILPGETKLEVLEAPQLLAVGSRWRYRQGESEAIYEVVTRDGDRLVIERRPAAETIEVELARGRLHVRTIRVPVLLRPASPPLVLAFEPFLPDLASPLRGQPQDATFRIDIAGNVAVVTGNVTADEGTFTMLPLEPAWTRARRIRIEAVRAGTRIDVRSSIGDG
jgi:hypothetical protein